MSPPSDRIVESTLPDGAPVRLRPIRASDREALAEGMKRLSPESRYRRFFSGMPELSAEALTYFTEIDYVDHFAWVAELPAEVGAPSVGVARYIRLEDDPDAAEAAVAVADDYQGRGVGTTLLEALALEARANGVRRFVATVLSENRPMLDLLRREGFHLRFDPKLGAMLCVADLPAGPLHNSDLYRAMRAAAAGTVDFKGPVP